MFLKSTMSISRFQSKLMRSFRTDPVKGFPKFGSRHPGPRQALSRLVPGAMTIVNRPVGALEQIVHPSFKQS